MFGHFCETLRLIGLRQRRQPHSFLDKRSIRETKKTNFSDEDNAEVLRNLSC